MKCLHYIIIAVGLILASCTMDDVKEVNPGQEIEFRVLTTKGEVVDLAKFEKFTVYAFKEDGSLYYTDEYKWNGASYVSPEKHMWPTDGSYVSFQAYHQASGELNVSKGVVKLENFMTDDDISEQVDFVSAVAKGNKSSGVISLDFQHRLAQIEVLGRNTNPGYKCYVAGLRIAHVKSKGSYNLSVDKWELDDDKGVYEIIYDEPFLLDDTATSLMRQEGDNAFFIPQDLEPWMLDADNEADGVYVALLVKITTATSNKEAPIYPLVDNNHNVIYPDYDWAALPLSGEWESGNKYVYNWDMPTVGGYVYPGKEMQPTGEYASQIDNFSPGTHIMGEKIYFLEPVMFPFTGEYINTEEYLIGTWNVDRMTLSVTKGDDDIQVLEMPSPQAVYSQGRLPEMLYSVEFDQNKMYTLNGGAEGEIISDDGTLCLVIDDVGVIEINDWSENQMSLYMKYVPQDDVIIEYQAYYLKEGATKEDLRDWEKQIDGVWTICEYNKKVVLENGEEDKSLAISYTSYEDIVATKNLVSEWFYVLTFTTPYEWYFNEHFYENTTDRVISYSLLLNDTLSLLVHIDDENYVMNSWYDVELVSDSQMIVSASSPYIINEEIVGTEYLELTYNK